MQLGGMLASFLMLPLSLPVSVSFCLFPLVYAAWLWLLSWGLCPPGVLVIIRVDYPASYEDMRSMDTVLRSLLRVPAYMLAPSFYGFLLCFHSLYAVFRLVYLLRVCRSMGYVYRATFVFCNSKCFSILYHLVFIIFFFFLTFCNVCFTIAL